MENSRPTARESGIARLYDDLSIAVDVHIKIIERPKAVGLLNGIHILG